MILFSFVAEMEHRRGSEPNIRGPNMGKRIKSFLLSNPMCIVATLVISVTLCIIMASSMVRSSAE